ncbi:DUF6920 family protein [Xanthomarina sp. F2636L]|uniref:DUF6920 family protein n=1 Tax=Xanthomarina sp. F2636L TaxID=2996018 RepID=UPI00225E405D|nr:DUF6544 family protein [Xanthomarina sp. F2636L]MCX7549643.1 hypothetical protein [Xanthomarina sp. F2636L]
MRIALIIFIGIHGIIHLFGFLKAFGIYEFNAISQPISKTLGWLWLVTFILFAISIVLLIFQSNYWCLSGFLAVIISQILIFNYWSDAKFGTIANLIILLSLILAYSSFSFKNKIAEERKKLFENSIAVSGEVITKEAISELPSSVQKWLTNNGTIGKKPISNVHLTQELQLKLNPDQESWNNGKAEQYITTNPPAFNWNINTKMNSIFNVVGRDKFENGNGEMTIKLLSLISVANENNSDKVDQATLQRYLAEMVWYPSASLSPFIKWESLDAYAAKATLEFKGAKGSGEFHFDEKGNFKKFVAMRYQDSKKTDPTEWTVIATQTKERNGIKIPVECEASWKLESGKWTWLKLKIKDIEYNVKEMPVPNKK